MPEVVAFERPGSGPGRGAGGGESGENGERWLYSVAAQILAILPLENPDAAARALRLATRMLENLPNITAT
jgi:hypothetical protein